MRMKCAMVMALMFARVAAGQTCLGQAGYEGGQWRAGASVASVPLPNGGPTGSQLAAELGVGAPGWPAFAAVSVARYSDGYSGDPAARLASLMLGYQLPLDVGSVCPVGVIEHSNYPAQQIGATTRSGLANRYGLGLAVGFPVKLTPEAQWRPYGAVSYQTKVVTSTSSTGAISADSSFSSKYAEFEGGIGFVIRLRLTIRPSFVYDFAYSTQAPSALRYLLTLSYNFGPGSKTAE